VISIYKPPLKKPLYYFFFSPIYPLAIARGVKNKYPCRRQEKRRKLPQGRGIKLGIRKEYNYAS